MCGHTALPPRAGISLSPSLSPTVPQAPVLLQLLPFPKHLEPVLFPVSPLLHLSVFSLRPRPPVLPPTSCLRELSPCLSPSQCKKFRDRLSLKQVENLREKLSASELFKDKKASYPQR